MRRFSASEYLAAHSVIPILAAAIVAGSLYNFAPGLALRKRSMAIALISIVSALLNLLLNLALVPSLGIHGAAIASLLSGVAGFALWYKAGQRLYSIPYDLLRLLASAAVVTLLAVVGHSCALFAGPAFKAAGLLVGVAVTALLLLRPSQLPSAATTAAPDPGQ